ASSSTLAISSCDELASISDVANRCRLKYDSVADAVKKRSATPRPTAAHRLIGGGEMTSARSAVGDPGVVNMRAEVSFDPCFKGNVHLLVNSARSCSRAAPYCIAK